MDASHRSIAYWSICIPIRIGMVVAAIYIPEIIAPFLVVMGISFFYQYATNARLDAWEGGGTAWWHDLRPYHGTLLLLAGVLSFKKQKYAYVPLIIDIVFGTYTFMFIRPTPTVQRV